MRQRLGIDRMLADKFSKEIPDIRLFVNEARRLATYAGEGKRVTAAIVSQQIAEIAGGARFEFASLVTEGKTVEAVAKLRDLVAQSRRDDPAMPVEVAVGRFIFPLADELRQMLAIQSFCRQRNMDPKRGVPYPMFKDQLADAINTYLVENGIAKQRAHPFPLHKRFEASRRYREQQLVDALAELARLEVSRKSGGTAAELGLELAVLRLGTR
jgi:DNA polymerase III delta subunit